LADGVQAAVQSMQNADREQIKRKVWAVIKARMEDGQLDKSPLTLRDLETIAESFTMVLSGVNHARITYPDLSGKETVTEAGNENPAVDKQ
ncbi:MAG: phosphohydrolase, partial [Clostridiales bacterium]|nr:phosphohydrolase [Clostridiales bacterium]